jgi:S1-C subfamily serine protease
MIEVSASVPPGDSGGALLGGSGVVGMNTAAGPDSGFAIPINTVLAIAHGLGARDGGPRGLDALRGSKAASTGEDGAVALLKGPRGGR